VAKGLQEENSIMAWASCEIDLAFDPSSFFSNTLPLRERERWKIRWFFLISFINCQSSPADKSLP